MKFIILQENLKQGLNIVERFIGKNPSLPILNNILLEAQKNFLKLSSTDLEVGVNYWVLIKSEKDGGLTVPARVLKDFVSALPNKKITAEEKNNSLFIELENYSTNIKGFSLEEFPIIPKIDGVNFIEINSFDLIQGLSQVVSIAAPSQIRPEISGVYVVFADNQIKIAATDSFRLAEKTLNLDKEKGKKVSFILPQKTCQELIGALDGKKGLVKIFTSPNQVLFEFPMEETNHALFQIISRLIEGEYPNYEEIIPKGFKTQIVLPKEEFLSQIKTASLFGGKINEVKLKADPQKEILEISSQSPDLGESKSQLPVKIKGEKAEVSFNWKFIQDGLSNIKSAEIILEINGDTGPGALRPVGDSSYVYIMMPIKGT